MAQRLLTVVVVHWNQPESCIETVAAFAGHARVPRVVVIDNGSTPANLDRLRAGISSNDVAELIEVGVNSGFGPGVNTGWKRWLDDPSGTEWVAVAPHDAQPADGTIDALIDTAYSQGSQRRLGLLSADVGDGASPFVDHVFGPITRPATTTDELELVDYPHGTLMLASRSCLQTIGLFDERFFSYCEEADLGLRAQDAGFVVGLLRGARVVNPHVNTPSPLVDYLQERNTVLLIAKHFGRRKAAMRFALTVWQLIRGIAQPESRAPYWNRSARVQAIRDVLRRSWGPPPDSVSTL